MEYIVVDFEWNQSPYGKGSGNKKLPFEIIEIGAVKLDENRNIIDRFSRTVRPKVYKKLHYITKELTGITQEELNTSEAFPYAAVDFMLWCGEEYMFCTWGNTDLVELQRNLKYHGLLDLLTGPIRYYNVQKLFRELCDRTNPSASLESAVDFLKVEKTSSFHRAINDAEYTAAVFECMDREDIKRWYTIDYYANPKRKREEIHLTYDSYYKFISREFDSKEAAAADREVRATRCYKCGKTAYKKIRWFSGKTKAYYCLAYCEEHGYIRGKFRLKKTDEQQIFAVKTLRLISEQDAAHIRQLKEEVREKRREKRHRDNTGTVDHISD